MRPEIGSDVQRAIHSDADELAPRDVDATVEMTGEELACMCHLEAAAVLEHRAARAEGERDDAISAARLYEARVEELQEENAALRRLLENAVFRVGARAREFLRAAAEQPECPLIAASMLDGGARALVCEGVKMAVSTEHGEVLVSGPHVDIRLAPRGPE